MVMRKIVVVGDKTTTSGVVLPNANSTFSVGDAGHKVALIGGQATCLACKGVGVIAKAGGPRRMDFMGEVALENDIVICGCPVHPKLVSNLHQTATHDDQAESQGTVPPPLGAGAKGLAATEDHAMQYDQHFQLQDEKTGEVLANRLYKIHYSGGVVEGRSDASGFTRKIIGNEAEQVKIEIFGEGA
jgi:type VI secretion system secreted protein VgrG